MTRFKRRVRRCGTSAVQSVQCFNHGVTEPSSNIIGPSQLVDRCPHCFQRTALDVRGTHVHVDNEDPPGSSYRFMKFWRLLQCVSCEQAVLQDVTWWEVEPDEERVDVVHPTTSDRSYEGLPESVARAYEACLKVQAVEPNAYAVLIGRLLEMVAVEEGVQGHRLVDQLRALADSGRIPPTLAEMADQLRQIRNLGAHAQAGDVSEADVSVIADFADAIIEYLYRAPAKIAAVRTRLEQQQGNLRTI